MEKIFDSSVFKLINENQQRIIDISNSINIPKIEIPTNFLEISKVFDSSIFKLINENQQRIIDISNSINIPKIEIPTNFLEISKIFDNSMFKAFQENQKIFESFFNLNSFNISNFDVDKYFGNIDKINIELIAETLLENFEKNERYKFDILMDSFLKSFQSNEPSKNVISKILYIIITVLIPTMHFYYNLLQNKSAYFVNRDNVRIRETPTTETNKNIIKKLNRNEYVIKIDNKDGWIKVKYNSEDGKELEGWIYKTMLSKID